MASLNLTDDYKALDNTFTLTNGNDNFLAYDYVEYAQNIGDRNLYVYGGGGIDFFESKNFFSIQDETLCPCGAQRIGARYALYDKDNPVTLNYFGEDGDDHLHFYNSGSSKLYGGNGIDSAKAEDGILFADYEFVIKPSGIIFEGVNNRLNPPTTSTFISDDIEFVYGPPEGGYLMSDLMNDEIIYYTDDELKIIRSQMQKSGTNYKSIKSVRGKGKLK